MLHMHFLITRKDGLSRQAFSDHWRNIHAPLASTIPGIRRYVQNHTPPIVSKNPPYDGIGRNLAGRRRSGQGGL